jgi:hypothetical protein
LFMCNAMLISMGLQVEEDETAVKVELPQEARWLLVFGIEGAKDELRKKLFCIIDGLFSWMFSLTVVVVLPLHQ